MRQAIKPDTVPPRSPGKHSATGEQTAPVPQAPRGQCARRSSQAPHPPVAPVSTAPPGSKRRQCHRPPAGNMPGDQARHRTTRSPGKRSATGEQTTPVPQAPAGNAPGDKARHRTMPVAPVSAAPPGSKRRQCHRPPAGNMPGDKARHRTMPVAPVSAAPPGSKRRQHHRPPQAIRQAIKPDTAPPVAPVSAAPPGSKRRQCHRPALPARSISFFMSAIDLYRVNDRHKNNATRRWRCRG